MIRLEKLRFFRRGSAPTPTPPAPAPAPARELTAAELENRRAMASTIFANGILPTNFTVTLGVAPCNYSCMFCPQSVSKPRKALWLDLDLLRKCLSEMPEQGILLNISSFSETIAAPNLVSSVRLMKEVRPKLEIVMASNGSLFRQQVVEDLIDAGLDWYQYSFDAPTRETYRELIQVDNFDKAWRNLEQIIELRNAKKSKMRIATHIMHYKGVEPDFERFKEHWQGKVDSVILRPMGNWGGQDKLKLMQKMADKGFVPEHRPREGRHPCNSIFMHFQIQPDGYYMPCLGTTPDYASDQKYALGHAAAMTWSEAWARLSKMRQAHLEGRWAEFERCQKCNIWSLWPDIWSENSGSGHRFSSPVPHAE